MVSIAQQNFVITIGGTDVSALVLDFDWGAYPLDQSGLAHRDGTIDIAGFPVLDLGIDTDPRTNAIWQFGSPVSITIANESGTQTAAFAGFIRKTPLPPQRAINDGIMSVEIADNLAYRLDRDPPGDESGVDLGTATAKGGICNRLLSAAGLSATLSVSGTLSAPSQKLGTESYVSQAGQVAYSQLQAIYANATGAIASQSVILRNIENQTPLITVTIGDSAAGEVDYEYVQGGENPANRVLVSGERQAVTEAENPISYTDTSYILVRNLMDRPDSTLDGDDRTIIQEQVATTETWTGNTKTINRNITRNLNLGGLNPDTINTTENTTERYESSSEGKLLQVRTIKTGIVADQRLNLLQFPPTAPDILTTPITLSVDTTNYLYNIDGTIRQRIRTYEESRFLSTDTPDLLTVFNRTTEAWERRGRSYVYRRSDEEVGALLGTSTFGNWGLFTTNRESKTGVQPPGTTYRENLKQWESEQIEGEVRFATTNGSTYDRFREYSVPYAETEVLLQQHAREFGKRLLGNAQGGAIELPIYDELIDPLPVFRLDVVEADGTTIAYAAHGHSWSFESGSRRFGTNLLFLGVVSSGLGLVEREWDIEDSFAAGLSVGAEFTDFPPVVPLAVEAGLTAGAVFAEILPPNFLTTGATIGAEFIDLGNELLFNAGLTIGADITDDGSELVFRAGLSAGFFSTQQLTPRASWVADLTVTEGAGATTTTAIATARLDRTSFNSITVDFATEDGTATEPDDYTATSGTLTFAPNTTQQLVTVTVIGDDTEEADEDFNINLTAPVNAFLGSKPSVTITIENDDTPTVNGWVAQYVSGTSIAVADASVTTWTEVDLLTFSGGPSGQRQSIAVGNGFVLIAGRRDGTFNGAVARCAVGDDLTNAANWSILDGGLTATTTRLEKIAYCGGSTFIATATVSGLSGDAVFATTDNGANWTEVVASGSGISWVAGNPDTNTGVFDGIAGTFSASPASGTYAATTNPVPFFSSAARYGNGRLVATEGTTSSPEFSYSDDDGDTWETPAVLGFSENCDDLAWVENDVWLAATDDNFVGRTTDLVTWSTANTGIYDVVGVDSDGQFAVAVCDIGRYIVSANKGITWSAEAIAIPGKTTNFASVRKF